MRLPGRDWTAREEVKIKMIIILEKRRLNRRFFHIFSEKD